MRSSQRRRKNPRTCGERGLEARNLDSGDTAGYGAMDGVKKVNNQSVLQKLERILDTININAAQGHASGN